MDEKPKANPNNIRKMNIETDLERVCEIWLKEAKEAHKKFIEEKFWDSRIPVFIKETRDWAKERCVYEEDEIITGFIIAREDGYIFELYVESQFKRQGIGTALFETLKGDNPKFPHLKGKYSQFTSSVYAHNGEIFPWHIKCGFKVFGIKFCKEKGLPKFDMIWERETRT